MTGADLQWWHFAIALATMLDHYDGWFGDDCRCDEIPCPLTLPAVTARPRPVTA